MKIRSLILKFLRKAALRLVRSSPLIKQLIREMVYESHKGSTGKADLIAKKKYNDQLANEQAGRCSPVNRAMPVRLTIETTRHCNLRCKMCQAHRSYEIKKKHTVDSAMPFELFEKIAKDTFPTVREVNFTAIGEPLMTPYLKKALAIVKDYSVKLDTFTNMTILPDGVLQQLVEVLSTLRVSFDASNKETFEEIRRGSNFDIVINNIKKFNKARMRLKKESRPTLSFNVTLMRSNIEELPGIIRLAHDLGADVVESGHIIIFEKSLQQESLIYHKKLANEFMSKAIDEAHRLGVDIGRFPKLFMKDSQCSAKELSPASNGLYTPSMDTRICDILWRESFIGSTGHVTPCCLPRRPVMGNIYQQPFEEIWNGEMYQAMRRNLNTRDRFECCEYCNRHIQSTCTDRLEPAVLCFDKG
ncbi:radical SAM protein [Candidatus Omnitrophota bacterium]